MLAVINIGSKVGKLTIIALETGTNKLHNQTTYKCLCECGNSKYVAAANLRSGFVSSCGCLSAASKSLVGQKFGRLTVLELAPKRPIDPARPRAHNRSRRWKCRCDCGNLTEVGTDKLNSGHTRSCGCLHTEVATSQFDKINAEKAENRGDPSLIAAGNVYNESYNDGDISLEQFIEVSRNPCHYCGILPYNKRLYPGGLTYASKEECSFTYNGLDIVKRREDADKPYIHLLSNTVPACGPCNLRKRHICYEDFLAMISNVHRLNLTPRNLVIIPLSDEELAEQMVDEWFYAFFANGRRYRTKKGMELYNRYWNYTDNESLTLEKFFYLTKFPCYYCGKEHSNFLRYEDENYEEQFYRYNGLDRLIQDDLHHIENIVPCCNECNKSKTLLNADGFIAWIEKVYAHMTSRGTLQ